MKILLINETFYPDVSATAQHLTELALEMQKLGHQVSVLCSDVCYENSNITNPKQEIYQGINIVRISGRRFEKGLRFNRVVQTLKNHLLFIWKLIGIGRFDHVVVLTSPPLISFWANLYCQVYRAKLFYWVMDLNPDEAVAAGWLTEHALTTRILETIHRFILKRCEAIVVLDHFMKDRILLKTLVKKIEVIAPWSHDDDLDVVMPEENVFIKENNLQGKFIVMYAGNHSICHPVDLFLQTAQLFKENEDIIFIFSGGGPRVSEVTNFKRLHRLNNILQFSYQPRERVKHLLSAADVHLVSMGKDFVGIVHPCKIYGILKLEKPFIFYGPEQSPIGELAQRAPIMLSLDSKDPERLAEWILKLKSSENPKQKTGTKNLADQFSKRVLLPRLVKIIS